MSATVTEVAKKPRAKRGEGLQRAAAKPKKVFIVASFVGPDGQPMAGMSKANLTIHGFFKSGEDAIEAMESNPGSVYLRGEVPPGR
jgi:hypothetical protein